MSFLVTEPYVAILPGRQTWVYLHCSDLERCDICLGRVAWFLALEMLGNLHAALNKPVAAYRAELGEGRCSLERAHELRRLTCTFCCPGLDRRQTFVADDFEIPGGTPVACQWRVPALVRAALWSMAALAIVFLTWWW